MWFTFYFYWIVLVYRLWLLAGGLVSLAGDERKEFHVGTLRFLKFLSSKIDTWCAVDGL